ncbi:FGGY family carbohydrate kinase, partial [Caenibacillus caldisaponilyticus]|uniref:FGGY family carbohydrate kinase n=1 Tax=Caenibacillus caldisaponilyticus TaxID=1674942 RepID=UPI00237884AF
MEYVIGVDLGTSAVKVLMLGQDGRVKETWTESYSLYQEHSGYSEQDPEQWVTKTKIALKNLLRKSGIHAEEVKGISFSGQMHGLVLLDEIGTPLRRAILWNDTRTSAECREIEATVGLETLLKNVKNRAFEGFTLPKILWV